MTVSGAFQATGLGQAVRMQYVRSGTVRSAVTAAATVMLHATSPILPPAGIASLSSGNSAGIPASGDSGFQPPYSFKITASPVSVRPSPRWTSAHSSIVSAVFAVAETPAVEDAQAVAAQKEDEARRDAVIRQRLRDRIDAARERAARAKQRGEPEDGELTPRDRIRVLGVVPPRGIATKL